MTACTMSKSDRAFRLIAGLAILGLYGALTPPWRYVALIGLLPLGTALTGFCPLHALPGWRRRRPAAGEREP